MDAIQPEGSVQYFPRWMHSIWSRDIKEQQCTYHFHRITQYTLHNFPSACRHVQFSTVWVIGGTAVHTVTSQRLAAGKGFCE